MEFCLLPWICRERRKAGGYNFYPLDDDNDVFGSKAKTSDRRGEEEALSTFGFTKTEYPGNKSDTRSFPRTYGDETTQYSAYGTSKVERDLGPSRLKDTGLDRKDEGEEEPLERITSPKDKDGRKLWSWVGPVQAVLIVWFCWAETEVGEFGVESSWKCLVPESGTCQHGIILEVWVYFKKNNQ